MRLDVIERLRKLVAVIEIGAEHDLRMDLDTRFHELLEHVDAALRVLPDEAFADIGRDSVERDVHGLETALDDPLDILVRDVRERHEVSLKEREPEVVVAQAERGARIGRQHAHEAEDAAVHAGADAVEQDIGEFDAPVLPRLAVELRAVYEAVMRVEDFELAISTVGLPAPCDDVGQLGAVHGKDAHARLDARAIGGTPLLDGSDPRPDAGGLGRCIVGTFGHGTPLRKLLERLDDRVDLGRGRRCAGGDSNRRCP